MGFFTSKEDEQFGKELETKQEENALGLSSKMIDNGNVAYDAQVSGKILEFSRRFLDWRLDKKGKMFLNEKFELKEPYLDEALCFIDEGEEKAVVNDIESALSDNYNAILHKYDDDLNLCRAFAIEFNHMSTALQSLKANSRITGKPIKAAKSQWVETQANIQRTNTNNNNNSQPSNKF